MQITQQMHSWLNLIRINLQITYFCESKFPEKSYIFQSEVFYEGNKTRTLQVQSLIIYLGLSLVPQISHSAHPVRLNIL